MANTPNPAKENEYEGAIDRGLEGIIACSSAISTIDGTTLIYRGYTIEDLAPGTHFWVLTAYDTELNESGLSEEISISLE